MVIAIDNLGAAHTVARERVHLLAKQTHELLDVCRVVPSIWRFDVALHCRQEAILGQMWR